MTYPSFSVGETLRAADMNAVGLWKAIPTGITGTGATLSSNVVTMNNAGALVVNGIFNSNFNDYVIVMRLSQSGSDVNIRLTSGGTEVATNTYNWSMMQAYSGAGVTTSRTSNTSSMVAMSNNNGSTGSAIVDVFAPFLASPTMFQINNMRNDGNLQTPANYLLFGNNTNSTSYDGVRIFGPTNMTGTIAFYARSK